MKLINYIAILILSYANTAAAQLMGNASTTGYVTDKGIAIRAEIQNGDTVPVVNLNTIYVSTERVFKNKKRAEYYWKLKRDVKKVYPYAILAQAKLREYNSILAKMDNELQKKEYMKKAEKELKNQFENDLKQLTFSQGKLLIKLIDRQTNYTSFELVQELRGSFSAFMWQSLASIFGMSLKTEYDADGKDKMTEDVIALVESGEI